MVGCCECCNKPLGSIKCVEFLDYIRNCKLLKKDSSLWYLLMYCIRKCKNDQKWVSSCSEPSSCYVNCAAKQNTLWSKSTRMHVVCSMIKQTSVFICCCSTQRAVGAGQCSRAPSRCSSRHGSLLAHHFRRESRGLQLLQEESSLLQHSWQRRTQSLFEDSKMAQECLSRAHLRRSNLTTVCVH
jgi:hypothetical protein